MAYITKDSVQKCLDDLSGENLIGNENDTFISLAEAKDRIEELPTADVVPKSEVERLTVELDAMRGAANSYKMHYENARVEVAREIIDEFMSAMRVKHEENRPKYGGALALLLPDIEQIATELKKKYTDATDTNDGHKTEGDGA